MVPARFADLLARADRDRLEIIGGEIVEKAIGTPSHAAAQFRLSASVAPFKDTWLLGAGVHVEYAGSEVYCHDLAGWRRDRAPERPREWPVRIHPDWVAEIASPEHKRSDLVDKPRVLHTAEVPHYWVIDPEERILLVHRRSRDGYVVVQRAAAGDVVRSEPFDALELRVGLLFGDEDSPEL
jgi:Uma2 family endonuclease